LERLFRPEHLLHEGLGGGSVQLHSAGYLAGVRSRGRELDHEVAQAVQRWRAVIRCWNAGWRVRIRRRSFRFVKSVTRARKSGLDARLRRRFRFLCRVGKQAHQLAE